MTIDWIGFGYASIIAFGGILGYHRKGSIVSLVASLSFGLLAGYGVYPISRDLQDVRMSLFTTFLLAAIMGIRFKRSKKLIASRDYDWPKPVDDFETHLDAHMRIPSYQGHNSHPFTTTD